MSTIAPVPTPIPAATRSQQTRSLTAWSWTMLGLFVVVWFLWGAASYLSLQWFGLAEGDLVLMARSVMGWVVSVAGWACLAAVPVAGIWLGVRAGRRRGGWRAWTAVAFNALVLLSVAYLVFDEIRMTYVPGITWPFPE